MKPWEEYQQQTTAAGPWTEYQSAPTNKKDNYLNSLPPDRREAASKPVKFGKDGFADSLREVMREASWGGRNFAGAGTALSNVWEGAKQFVGQGDADRIAANRIIEEEAPVGAIAGNVAMTALPFMGAAKAATASPALLAGAGRLAASGAGLGALQPVQGEQSFGNIAKGKLINTGIGGASGVVGAGAGNLIGKGISKASSKMISLEQRVAAKAATDAASETASARSAAGNAAQNAYKQLEHLRELKAFRGLSADEAAVAHELEKELAGKAVEKLMPAVALKNSTSQAYREAIETEADRSAKLAAERISGKEAKAQFMARLKRYGPAAAGGIAGNLIFPGLGGAVGGAASGLVLRPAIHSMRRLAQNPAVQHKLLSPISNSGLLADAADPRMMGLLLPSIYAAQQ